MFQQKAMARHEPNFGPVKVVRLDAFGVQLATGRPLTTVQTYQVDAHPCRPSVMCSREQFSTRPVTNRTDFSDYYRSSRNVLVRFPSNSEAVRRDPQFSSAKLGI